MLTTPVMTARDVADIATFDALLWALSRPGKPRTLPTAEDGPIIEALLDRECRVHTADPLLMSRILRTGAVISEMSRADHVFLGALTDIGALHQTRVGSDLYPDGGATVILRATLGAGPVLRLSGPGIDGTLDVAIDSLPAGFWQERARIVRYPMGFDLFLRDGRKVIGIPRSTKVEVL